MNPLNYATREASQRLLDNEIVLETDCYYSGTGIWSKDDIIEWEGRIGKDLIPAPSLAEVWKELPFNSVISKGGDGESWAQIEYDNPMKTLDSGQRDFNPTDALIDLLIWVRANPDKSTGTPSKTVTEWEYAHD